MAASLADPPLALSSAFSGGYVSSSSSNIATDADAISESDFDSDYLPPASRYQLFEKLGEGAFGEVRLAGR